MMAWAWPGPAANHRELRPLKRKTSSDTPPFNGRQRPKHESFSPADLTVQRGAVSASDEGKLEDNGPPRALRKERGALSSARSCLFFSLVQCYGRLLR